MPDLNPDPDASLDNTCSDCSPFLNWNKEEFESEHEKAIVFRSLVATVKSQPSLDDSLEAKAVQFLKSVSPVTQSSADAFLNSLASFFDDSLTDFVQSIEVLISTPNQIITTETMKMLETLFTNSSTKIRLTLVKADLIHRLIITLHPLSISFADAVDIHINVMKIIHNSLWPATPNGLARLGIEDDDEQQAVQEITFQQVLVPSVQYISHLCMNRYSIVDGAQSILFLIFLTQLLEICPYYQPTMEFVLHMPLFLTIPSCLTFFETERSICACLYFMVGTQREWNDQSGKVRQMWKTLHRLLRMEGIDDVIEAKLGNDKTSSYGRSLVSDSILWNNLLGMNLPEPE
ncbi:hypothetical protein BLNAU_9843 [Blattamonas nauphoetae]|uniref:Uncharacterized protein n=1 Tax=Blattamonas nauphoetae TaxID=2049346 RepID=A0ABQ9XUG2_9EUKA|nr:hypothetical protein BLNAU_9843 [Blattamonas nauphoetae]